MDLYHCHICNRYLASSESVPPGLGCPWCWRDTHEHKQMVHINVAVEPTEMAKNFPPGTTVKHLLTGQDMTVLELEGDGSTGWFTARTKDFATHRVRYVEVEVVSAAPEQKGHGTYL